jgi:hypothetical protein
MTEGRWLRCTEPILMLEFLRDSGNDSERKLRLFAAACCRRAWHLLDADGRAVVEMSERFADGSADEAELKAAIWASRGCQDIYARDAVDAAAVGAWRPAVATLAVVCGRPPGCVSSPADPTVSGRERAAEGRVQADLLRDVLGTLPFRRRPLDTPWQTPLVRSLAQAAYEERVAPDPSRPGWLVLDPVRLLVLADALEEAGADAGLLGHLRQPRDHVRGCWCIDVLLGKR